MAGRWHAFLATGTHEPRVVLMTLPQPWGHKTRQEALRYLRPRVQRMLMQARTEAELLAAAANAVDVLMAKETDT